jgi:hypothetical protein
MKDLIKKLLKEQEDKYDTLEMLKNYEGDNKVLQDLSRELRVIGKLSNTKIENAVKQFKKEFYEPTILGSLQFNLPTQKIIQDLGTKTYKDLIRSKKRLLMSNLTKVRIDKPERSWLNRNVHDLRFFRKHIPKTEEKFQFNDRDVTSTINDEVNHLLKLLVQRDFWGFIEGKEWSIFNRINTNYTNWNKLIAKRDKNNELGNGSVTKKVNEYFAQKPIEQIHDLGDFSSEEKTKIKELIPTLSYADEDVITILQNAESPDTDYDFNKMKKRIQKTTNKGETTENDFIDWLKLNNIPDSDIQNFSSYGNLVDITFQCDLMVKLKGVWTPIQVKSKDQKYSNLLSYGIGGLLVYPAPKKLKCGKWVYFDGKSLPKSFDEDFLNLHCQ